MDTVRFVFLVLGATFLLLFPLSLTGLANEIHAPSPEDETHLLYENPEERKARDRLYKAKFSDEKSLEEKLIDEIPYGGRLKHLWHIADGDVDLYVDGLRFNRKNTGLDYTTNTLPMVGEMDGITLQFKAGEEMEFSFESQIMPFVGDIEGFSFKGSVGDNSRISARYTIALD